MSKQRKMLGALGERLAREYLLRQGYTIRETNVRTPHGEIDIVAEEGEYLVFVEVRTRRGSSFGIPEESVTHAKREKLVALANEYLQRLEEEIPWRIDVVAVELSTQGKVIRIELLRDAVSGDSLSPRPLPTD